MPGWWRRRSLRARLTMATTAGLAVALLLGAMLLRSTLRGSLIDGLDNTARQGAREVAALADARHLPDPVPVAAGTLTVQVLAPDGRIMDASPGADRLVPLLPPGQAAANARAGRAVVLNGRPFGIPYLLRVVAVAGHRGEIVLAGVDFQSVDSSITELGRELLVGTPLLLLLLAWVTWLVVGSTLRPIAALRRGAQEVTATAQPSPLPVPEARDEVHSLAVTLNDMLARLDAAQRRQRGLISDTAHELRSPIASIRAQLEVALDHPGQQDWPQTASDVLADTLRLARLAEDLLFLARLDEHGDRGTGGGGPVDLAALAAQEAARAAGGRVPVRAVAGEDGETGGQYLVTGYVEGLRRVLVNLIENAVRYAKSGVDVEVTADGTHVIVRVTDDGPGIPEADRERAFGRFVRLDDARSRDDDGTEGAGLGLAIVRATAQAHGGSAWLEDASPGLRAVVRLPAATSHPTAAAR
ncbi:MAG TPA: HAMP domain-containing sensor histidine kinase [Streptosporangiaceae bacterium]|jgi:signal transduction histidine kinase